MSVYETLIGQTSRKPVVALHSERLRVGQPGTGTAVTVRLGEIDGKTGRFSFRSDATTRHDSRKHGIFVVHSWSCHALPPTSAHSSVNTIFTIEWESLNVDSIDLNLRSITAESGQVINDSLGATLDKEPFIPKGSSNTLTLPMDSRVMAAPTALGAWRSDPILFPPSTADYRDYVGNIPLPVPVKMQWFGFEQTIRGTVRRELLPEIPSGVSVLHDALFADSDIPRVIWLHGELFLDE